MYTTDIILTSLNNNCIQFISDLIDNSDIKQLFKIKQKQLILHRTTNYSIISHLEIITKQSIEKQLNNILMKHFEHYPNQFYHITDMEQLKMFLINKLFQKKEYYQIYSKYNSKVDVDFYDF